MKLSGYIGKLMRRQKMIDIIIALAVGFLGGLLFGIFFIVVLAMANDKNEKEEEK